MRGNRIMARRTPFLTGRFIASSILLFLLLLPVTAAGSEPWAPKPKADQVLSPRLTAPSPELDESDRKAWVFFTDKQISNEGEYLRAVSRANRSLDGHATIRRQKMKHTTLAGIHDLPVPRDYIDRVLAAGAGHRTTTRYLNGVSVEAPVEVLRRIAEFPFVRSIEPVRSSSRKPVTPDRPAPKRAAGKFLYNMNYGPSLGQLEMIQVPALHDLGFSGNGVRICMLDTGFKRSHEALDGVNVIAEWDFINDDPNTSEEPGDPSGQHSHGTKILSLIGGNQTGELIGPAYGAEYLLGKTEDVSQEEPIEEDWWVEGVEWADSNGADIIASSLGYKDWYTYADMDGNTATTTIAADLAAWNGILVCTSAGNEGDSDWIYMLAPADADSIIATGAVWYDSTLASFSSRGPTYDGRIKPDLAAQGVYTYSVDPYTNSGYDDCHGTSCSNPILAGAAALVLEANPFLTPFELITLLKENASQASSPDTALGWGIIQTADAMNQATYVQIENELTNYGYKPPVMPKALTLAASPNPFNPTVLLTVNLLSPSFLKVRIYDARGALVDTLAAESLDTGEHSFPWNGTDRLGRDVPSGVYFARAEGVGLKVVEKLNLVR